jgi:hypothetical protein
MQLYLSSTNSNHTSNMQRKHPVLSRARLPFLAYSICLLLYVSHHLSVHAQYQPQLTTESGSSFIEGRGLYILSGYDIQAKPIPQAFMIDLSVSWKTTSPAYKSLPTGPIIALGIASALSADGQKWLALNGTWVNVLDLQSNNSWSRIFQNPGLIRGTYGIRAATDPASGKVYIPYGYDGILESMMIVDLKDNSYSIENINIFLAPSVMYAFTWNAMLGRFLFSNWGTMYTYSPSDGWAAFDGPQELPQSDSVCMASSGSGSTVVLFGGSIGGLKKTSGDIFILDVPTLTWRKGPSTSPQDARRACACAVSNNYFIAWGGQFSFDRPVIPPKQMTLVFNLKIDKWVSDYNTSTNLPDNKVPLPTSTNLSGTADSPFNVWVIIGAVCGGLGLVLITGIIYREYQSHKDRSNKRPGGGIEEIETNEAVQPTELV